MANLKFIVGILCFISNILCLRAQETADLIQMAFPESETSTGVQFLNPTYDYRMVEKPDGTQWFSEGSFDCTVKVQSRTVYATIEDPQLNLKENVLLEPSGIENEYFLSIPKLTNRGIVVIIYITPKETLLMSKIIFMFDYLLPEDYEKIYGHSKVELNFVDSETDNSTIYDVMGRRVKKMVPGSIYIRGGKKFVAK